MDQPTDPERPRDRPFDRDDHFTGQMYHRDEEARAGAAMPAGSVGTPGEPGRDDPDLPPENGRRASFDPATGEVHGSGVGAGGGQPGEDMDEDTGGDEEADGPIA